MWARTFSFSGRIPVSRTLPGKVDAGARAMFLSRKAFGAEFATFERRGCVVLAQRCFSNFSISTSNAFSIVTAKSPRGLE